MESVTATFRNGRIELTEPVNWADGTPVRVTPVRALDRQPLTRWPDGFFDELRRQWGEEPFERPPQGEFEVREEW